MPRGRAIAGPGLGCQLWSNPRGLRDPLHTEPVDHLVQHEHEGPIERLGVSCDAGADLGPRPAEPHSTGPQGESSIIRKRQCLSARKEGSVAFEASVLTGSSYPDARCPRHITITSAPLCSSWQATGHGSRAGPTMDS